MGEKQDPQTLDAAVTAMFRVSALLDAMRLRIWDAEGLTVTQLRLLGHVHESPGISNAELAERLYVTRPSVSALLERLERGGFIRREISQSDRRGICIWLEERGKNAVTNVRAESREYARRLMEDLSNEDLREIAAALQKLATAGAARRARDLEHEPVGP
ncbi:MAG: MarR family winged helix-turn-helix transcriptional regulator [Hyphomicrobiales bacterium]